MIEHSIQAFQVCNRFYTHQGELLHTPTGLGSLWQGSLDLELQWFKDLQSLGLC